MYVIHTCFDESFFIPCNSWDTFHKSLLLLWGIVILLLFFSRHVVAFIVAGISVTWPKVFSKILIWEQRPIAIDEKPFQAPKIIFKSPKLIGQKSLLYGHLLKGKSLKFTFLTEPIFQVLLRGSSPSKNT